MLIVAGLVLLVALALAGGPGNAFDAATIDCATAQRLAYPALTMIGVTITHAGGAPALVGLTLLAAAILVRNSKPRALALLAIVLGGRLAVELLKATVARPRPAFDPHPVTVHSLSFPSGHAANSMISLVAIALLCAPPRRRPAALTVAIAASLAIGATRPLLGVHWPSDVLAGWIFGLLWALTAWSLLRTRLEPLRPG